MNRKGFTLIELLAVIVILSVVLGIAIPSVTGYIVNSEKQGYVATVLQYVDAARKNGILGTNFKYPKEADSSVVISFGTLQDYLDKGGLESPYGNRWILDKSFVVILNVGTKEEPKYNYYVTAYDGMYAIGVADASGSTSAMVIEEDSIDVSNVVRVTSGISLPTTSTKYAISGDTLVVNGSGLYSVFRVY
ncbi:MAG: type II secretion system protein [Firmicutes bacterium]|nr:type II secretion system protein [Bacillota bacterium]